VAQGTAHASLHQLAAEDVAGRARQFPRLADLVEDSLGRLSAGGSVSRKTSPHLLSLLGAGGGQTMDLLEGLDQAVRELDEAAFPGWDGVRSSLGRAQRRDFLAALSELVVAQFAAAVGLTLERFEPPAATGRRADLLLADGGEHLLVEVITPWTTDWTARDNDRLSEILARVPSGLAIVVDGFDALDFSDPRSWGKPHPRPGAPGIDELVGRFRRVAGRLNRHDLPTVLIAPSPGQPVRITATEYDPKRAGTAVVISWSSSGLVPAVDRLAERILAERKHFGGRAPAAILVDLSNWSDFRDEGYYLAEVAARLRRHRLPTMVGAFSWRPPSLFPIARSVLHLDTESARRAGIARALAGAWSD
jgi:hypothetical protein